MLVKWLYSMFRNVYHLYHKHFDLLLSFKPVSTQNFFIRVKNDYKSINCLKLLIKLLTIRSIYIYVVINKCF